MDSLFPTRQRINGQLVYSANRLLGREVQTRYTRAATSSRLELKKKKESTLRSNWNISVVLFSGEVLLLIFLFIVFLTDPVKAPEICKIAKFLGLMICTFLFFLGGGGGWLGWVWICKKEDLATIIVTLKKESIFRFSR